ncbi:DNA helicase/exodeoxyribonuclease V subunit A [Anoxybacillus vitaminiphilus]|uniref:ATP-dependent helicase/nuclease subunit A n=1 Tax=Paranoxybacillus vitaminiphilus TaxID=581036 RepID=A0A327YGB7_9BACL|nr:helicase-exonuclease AddAB subunit AddA [Anoxybacillus vitaminiphilus]RAK19517.1 DNA helicase/exodeoxyribonuclease V subunit A [Anoxybacillus vitaminiphilus]
MSDLLRPKPPGSHWTDEQWKAIVADGQDILVAAAAGSGKTAVLVERIIEKIVAKDDPVDVDRLLVVTFTNASAAEMKTRIGEAIEKEIEKHPSSLHLRRQLSLLNRASISTIHSFCLDVIRKYYYLIDIDPVFRIADETEAALLKEEVMEELFEEQYGKEGNEAFFNVVDRYTSDRTDEDLQQLILELYEFSRSHPYPSAWLDQLVNMYDISEDTAVEQLPYTAYLSRYLDMEFQAVKDLLTKALEIAYLPGGPLPRAENFLDDLQIVERLIEAKKRSWQELYEQMHAFSFSRAKTCRGDEYKKELLDKASSLRETAKKKLEGIRDELFSFRPQTWLRHMKEMKPIVEVIVQLVKEFAERFRQAKLEKGLVDFSDLEHYCLQILRHPDSTSDKLIPSDAALDYRAQFVEVLVDEYQDVNMVQESILQLVTKEHEQTGNLFMVGDVKQSIYRFRLAEPFLFLSKYKRFTPDGRQTGLKIDLSRNFRSRTEVLDGTNFIFKQIMGETVGEIAYDEDAELKFGANDYPENKNAAVEFLMINRADTEKEIQAEIDESNFDLIELETVQLEARLMAQKIKQLISEPFEVYDRKLKRSRRVMYRDIVILLRSMPWAPQIIEEFRQQGIPVYADLSSGYFEATEVSIMLSLLKIIDNPYQDIPLAAVLRSPIVGLDENELAMIRIHNRKGTYYEALISFLNKVTADPKEQNLQHRLRQFYDELQQWRTKARQGSLADLIWQLYRETHFYDFVGGMPGGKQRQANLRALYDRARQYEATSFRGLFRFLRFIERMQNRGDDLGAARALGEQEDVVRLMTIHSSKGLEFPVVFVAGLARRFNLKDINRSYLLDKELGFATRFVDAKLRISYPTLPQLAMKRKLRFDLLAEEMRVLYVALTRAKEKLYLIGTVKDAGKEMENWKNYLTHTDWLLPDAVRASANCYLDWIGPALIRHRDSSKLHGESVVTSLEEIANHPSKWHIEMIEAKTLQQTDETTQQQNDQIIKSLEKMHPISQPSEYKEKIYYYLTWEYNDQLLTMLRAKQSVSELKRQREIFGENADDALLRPFSSPIAKRPLFMQEKKLTAAEKGTAMHMVMQHVELTKPITEETVREQIAKMVNEELLTYEQAESVDVLSVVAFFATDIGKRLLKAKYIYREIPFSLSLAASEVYRLEGKSERENVLIQGVVDCMFEDEAGLVLIDFKTDAITNRFPGGLDQAKAVLEKRYRTQVDLYRRAIEQIWKKEVKECYLYLFDGSYLLSM